MYWRGLRTFNLKVGFDGDSARLKHVAAYLRRALASGRASLRVDADGSWSKDDAIEWLSDAATVPLAAVEQPLARGQEDDLLVLRDLFAIPIIHDESLVTIEDGRRLIDLGLTDGFNIRIGKCGGLIPSLRLAALARRADVRIQVGCTFGETSILSAAALCLLQVCPGVAWADGRFGAPRPRRDFVVKGLRFGYGGRPPRLPAPGLGIDIDPHRLRRSCTDKPVTINL
jgi:muconate cycloisomerase